MGCQWIKFYSFLVEKDVVAAEQVERMRERVKKEMPQWQERARRNNDPTITDPSNSWI